MSCFRNFCVQFTLFLGKRVTVTQPSLIIISLQSIGTLLHNWLLHSSKFKFELRTLRPHHQSFIIFFVTPNSILIIFWRTPLLTLPSVLIYQWSVQYYKYFIQFYQNPSSSIELWQVPNRARNIAHNMNHVTGKFVQKEISKAAVKFRLAVGIANTKYWYYHVLVNRCPNSLKLSHDIYRVGVI